MRFDKGIKSKIALFCNVDEDAVITAKDVESIYEVPLVFHAEGLDEKISQVLNMLTGQPDLRQWEELIEAQRNPKARSPLRWWVNTSISSRATKA